MNDTTLGKITSVQFGTEDGRFGLWLTLSGFWEDTQGSISHVAIFGDDTGDRTVVPVPPAAWLFMSGLLGLVAVSRRKV